MNEQPKENQNAGQEIPVQNTKLAGIQHFHNRKWGTAGVSFGESEDKTPFPGDFAGEWR